MRLFLRKYKILVQDRTLVHVNFVVLWGFIYETCTNDIHIVRGTTVLPNLSSSIPSNVDNCIPEIYTWVVRNQSSCYLHYWNLSHRSVWRFTVTHHFHSPLLEKVGQKKEAPVPNRTLVGQVSMELELN
uniref:Ovule protein n=1 Tax=Ascaris lumbricoides TaxID=6252 RepID=A0A0M3HSG8_ASCLU